MKEDLTNTILHLQEAENKFYAKSCSHDGDYQNQTGENASGQTDVRCSEGEATDSVQASSSSSQQFQRTPTPIKTESQNVNQTHTSEIKTAEKIASLAVNKSTQEQDTVTEKPPELAFQDALTSSEEDILSGTLKDIYDRSITNNFEQEKKEVVRDNLKVLESEDHKLTGKMEDSKMEKK